jgi:hypothetical protein
MVDKLKKISRSPIPQTEEVKEVVKMTLPQALNEVIDGKKITRYEWDNKEVYGHLFGEWLCIFRGDTDKQNHVWNINDGDLLAIDWIVIE